MGARISILSISKVSTFVRLVLAIILSTVSCLSTYRYSYSQIGIQIDKIGADTCHHSNNQENNKSHQLHSRPVTAAIPIGNNILRAVIAPLRVS